ncbi:MAG TPA: multicopper oxidase domain-containing protein [Gemmatimonadaceae bacterium]
MRHLWLAGPLLIASAFSVRSVEHIAINDNRTPAGLLRHGVLTAHLEVREGEWHPDADAGLGGVVRAFAVEDGPLQNPGPLLRVPAGTEMRVWIRNSIGERLVLHGLTTHGAQGAGSDTASVAPGEAREIRFTANTVGTFYYWASTNADPRVGARDAGNSQLSGALVVDPAGGADRPDRIFLIGSWNTRVRVDTGLVPVGRFVINGKSWPHTERLTYAIGDSVHIRVINAGVAAHPMHLHGFYYNVDSRGDGRSDSIFAPTSSPHLVNTERLTTGRTFSMTWVPTRAGNWLFHCHDPVHIQASPGLDGTPPMPDAALSADHMLEMMSGPVIGISIREAGGARPMVEPPTRRRLRLIAREDSGSTPLEPAFGYTLDTGGTLPAYPGRPGPTLVLQRGEPVSVTIVNHLREPTSVHWHGIELDSYYDGVAGFAGHPGHLAPEIAPNDSFVARFTPPRSGTFMYHPHVGEVRQQQAGLDGALIVVDSIRRYEPATEIVLLVTSPRSSRDGANLLLNGTATPALRELHAGAKYRVRLLNLHNSRPGLIIKVMRDSALLTWRAVAKDGMTLPPDQATVRASSQQIGNGETYDFEFVPATPGDLRLDVTDGRGQLLLSAPMNVR